VERHEVSRIFSSSCSFLLSPAIGELLSGSAPPLEFFNPFGFAMLASLYGSGAVTFIVFAPLQELDATRTDNPVGMSFVGLTFLAGSVLLGRRVWVASRAG